MNGWRAHVDHSYRFAADELHLLLGQNTPGGMRVAVPVAFELREPTVDPAVVPLEPPFWMTLPYDAARALYEALAAEFRDPIQEADLRRRAEAAERRLDHALEGLAALKKLGGRS